MRVDSPERKEKKKLLYGNNYRTRARAMKAQATHCHLCGKAFEFGDNIEADHLIAGHPDSPLAPAHRECNRRRGNRELS